MTEVAAASRASMGHMMLQKQRGWEMLIYCVIGFSKETNESQERHGEEPAVEVFLQKTIIILFNSLGPVCRAG